MISSFSTRTTIDLSRSTIAELFEKEISLNLFRKGVIYYSNGREQEPISYPPLNCRKRVDVLK
jgi:hypothetical protein